MSRKFWLGTLSFALLLSLAWGFNEYRVAGNLRLVADNERNRAFYDMAGQLDQVETNMAKVNVANSSNQKIFYLSQAWSRTDAANKDFAQLPAEQVGISYIGQFLTQIGDFSRTLAAKVASGSNLSANEEKTYRDMHTRLLDVNRKVQDLALRFDTEKLAWNQPGPSIWQRVGLGRPQLAEAAAAGQGGPVSSIRGGLDQLDSSLQKLPPFSYVGEFSTRTVPEPLGLPAKQVNQDQAKIIAQNFLAKVGYKGAVPTFGGVVQGPFAGYVWNYKDAYLQVTRQGGVIRLYQDQRPLQVKKLSVNEAKDRAMAILQSLGWKLVLTSVEDDGSYLRLEAVNETNGVLYYPDKVRLMVARDNGQLIGLDATAYWAYHHQRALPKKLLPLLDARQKLRPGFKVTDERLALITKPGNKEVLCYEFRGLYEGEEYLIYLNATNGVEEKIQRIIKTPRGEYLE